MFLPHSPPAHLQGRSVQSCIDLTELQSRPGSTIPGDTADTPVQSPTHCGCSMSPLDICTEWGTCCQVGSNALQSRRAVASGCLQFLIKHNII